MIGVDLQAHGGTGLLGRAMTAESLIGTPQHQGYIAKAPGGKATWVDAVRISAATKLFELLGGGAQDAGQYRSGMGRNHFAVIPNATHYDIVVNTEVSRVAIPFLGGYPSSGGGHPRRHSPTAAPCIALHGLQAR